MHPDKKTQELEQLAELEREKKLQQEDEMGQEEESEEDDDVEEELEQKVEARQGDENHVETEIERASKKRKEAMFEMALFFILGVLIGITLKTEAVKRITIGFNDYQIVKTQQSYNIEDLKNQMKRAVEQQQAQQQLQQQAQQQPAQK